MGITRRVDDIEVNILLLEKVLEDLAAKSALSTIPGEVVAFSSPALSKCMDKNCSKPPTHEVLWAEGMGHCWFCRSHLLSWVKRHRDEAKTEGWGLDVDSIKAVKGKASQRFRDNTSPNVLPTVLKVLGKSTVTVKRPKPVELNRDSNIGGNHTKAYKWKTLPSGRQIMVRKGDSGALSGNDFRKINIAVKAASADPSKIDEIRNNLVGGYIPKDEDVRRQETLLLNGTHSWVASSASEGAAGMCMSNNKMKGRDRKAGLSRRQLKAADYLDENFDPFPKPSMEKSTNVMAMFNRGMAKEKFGDKPFTVYRGIYGKQAEDIKAKAKKGDTVRINSNTLSSFTTSLTVAKSFKSNNGFDNPGIIIRTKVSYKNVFDSYASNPTLSALGKFKVNEVIVAPRGLKIVGEIIDD